MPPVAAANEPLPGRAVSVRGGTLWLVEHGAGEPVVLLHGIPSTSYLWRKVQRLLAADCRTLAFDLAGLGRSRTHDGRGLDLAAQADAVREACARLGVGRPVLVGHDVGGGVVHHFVSRHPDAVGAVVLVDAVAFARWWPVASVRLLRVPVLGEAAALLGPFAAVLRAQLRKGFAEPQRATADVLWHYHQPLAGWPARGRFVAFLRALDPAATEAAVRRYPDLPVRITWGEHDAFQPLAAGIALRDALPRATWRVVAAGHFVPEEQPHAVADEIRAALAMARGW
jgi:pimeloyl-ACP methyl ester carboxylesterase